MTRHTGVLRAAWTRARLWPRGIFGATPEVIGRVRIHGPGTLRLGERVRLDASTAPIELFVGPGAELVLGDDVDIEGGASIEALESVRIGAGCRIGAYCKIMDNNFHQMSGDRRAAPPSVPVVIEAGARLESGAIVLPGAHIRRGQVVARGAVARGRPAPTAAHTPSAAAPQKTGFPRVLERLLNEPLKVLRFEIARLRAAFALRDCRTGARVFAFGDVRVENRGEIVLGDRVGFREGMTPTELVCHEGARISVAADSFFNYAARIEAHQSVTIGARCMIASMTRIADAADAPIVIGDDVWIAHGAIIAPGVAIGDGAVISAGSLVIRDVPPRSLAVGSPARCINLSLLGGG